MKNLAIVVISCLLFSACAAVGKNTNKEDPMGKPAPSCKAGQDPNALLDSLESARVEMNESNDMVETKKRKWWQVWKPKTYSTGKVVNSYGRVLTVSSDGCPGRMFVNSDGRVVMKCVGLQDGKEYCKILQKKDDEYAWVSGHASTFSISLVGATLSGTDCNSGPIQFNWPGGSCKWSTSLSSAGMMLTISGDKGQVFKVLLKDPKHKDWVFNEDPERK